MPWRNYKHGLTVKKKKNYKDEELRKRDELEATNHFDRAAAG